MSFEKPDLDTESSKSEQEPLAPDFLQEQVRLPEDQWDEKFRKLIEEKIREDQQENERFRKSVEEEVDEPEEPPEILRERDFKRYTVGLGLDETKLKDKKILDLGCCEGEFVKFLIEKGITPEAYGLDLELDETAIEDKFKAHFFQGNFEEDLPVKNVDYVVSVGAVSNGICAGEEVMDIRRIVEKSLASLKEGGEVRMYPMQEAAKATMIFEEGLVKSQQKWDELLAEISETQGVEYKIEPRNIKVLVGKNNNDIILESVLIIRRKKEKHLDK
jgi:SAM-dependent methyltransferase